MAENDVIKDWKKFLADTSVIDKAKNVKVSSDKSIIELFVVYTKTSVFVNGIVDPTKVSQDQKRWWTLAKVISSTKYPVGSIVKIPNEVGRLVENPAYASEVKHNAMYPNDQHELPARFLGNQNILVWLTQYAFVFNPLKDDADQTNYFIIPNHNIECEMDKDLIV